MADLSARPAGAASSARLAELHQLCDQDYAKGRLERARAAAIAHPPYAISSAPEPTDLDVAIGVAQRMLDSADLPTMREALRLLLRALGAEGAAVGEPAFVSHENGLTFKVIPADSPFARIARGVRQLKMTDGRVWTVGSPIGWHGAGAAWRPQETEATRPDRCPAAHPEDSTPCDGPPVVTVLDRTNAGADGCAHHGARLLASLDGGRVYALPDAPSGSAIAVFKAADSVRPFPWVSDGPRNLAEQLSHAESRQRGEGK